MKVQNFLGFVAEWLWSDSEGGVIRLLIYNRYESLICFWIECLRNYKSLWWISSEQNVLYCWYNLLRFLICLRMVGVTHGRPLHFLGILCGSYILIHTLYGSVSKLYQITKVISYISTKQLELYKHLTKIAILLFTKKVLLLHAVNQLSYSQLYPNFIILLFYSDFVWNRLHSILFL